MSSENLPDKLGGKKRSSKWPKVRKAWLKKHPKCAICEGTVHLNVHHKAPFNLFPDLEEKESNLITLCEGKKTVNCHLIFGHWGNFQLKYNPHIDDDTRMWRARILLKKKMK